MDQCTRLEQEQNKTLTLLCVVSVRPGSLAGSLGTNQRHIQFADVVFVFWPQVK